MEFYVTRGNSLSHKEDGTLEHHGILGMKWGVRRYQNYDGTRTAAGKKRYWTGAGLADKNGESSGKNNTSKVSETDRKAAVHILNKYDSEVLSPYNFNSERGRKAATLTLKAFDKMEDGRGKWLFEKYSPTDKEAQDAVLFDDWAPGYPQVADMILRGYTADKAKQAVRDISDAFWKTVQSGDAWEEDYNLYDIIDGGSSRYNGFIDVCADIYKSEKKKTKNGGGA